MPDLTQEDAEMIDDFRHLDEEDQNLILHLVARLAAKNGKPDLAQIAAPLIQ